MQFGKNGPLSVLIHENYNTRTLENDIAIITLDRKVSFTQFIRPICLPSLDPNQKSSVSSKYEGKTVNIAGMNKRLDHKNKDSKWKSI